MASSNELRLNLLITAEDGTLKVFQGVEGNLKKVEGVASDAGVSSGGAFSAGFGATALQGIAALGAAVGGLKLFEFAKEAFADTVKFSRANAELAAQIEATGGAAGVTTGSIGELAQEIEKTQEEYSGAVKQGAALLLTFQEIRNFGGQGNNIFDRTLQVSAAIANIFHKDIQAAVLQIGRALENPEAGMQALSRSGLTLAKQDRERVLDLAKQGDLLGSQKVLLDVLESRTKEASEAAIKADPLQRLGVEIEKFRVNIGKDIAPVFTVGAEGLERLLNAFDQLPNSIRTTIEAAAGLGIAYEIIVKLAAGARALNLALGGGRAVAAGIEAVTAAEVAQAASMQALVVAGTEAAVAQAELDAVIAGGIISTEAYDAALVKVAVTQGVLNAANLEGVVTQEALNVARQQSTVGSAGMLASFTQVGLVIGGAAVATRFLGDEISKIHLPGFLDHDDPKKFRFDTATDSLKELGRTGEATGLVADAAGDHFKDLANNINRVADQSLNDKFDNVGRQIAGIFGGKTTHDKDIDNSAKAVNTLDKALAAMAEKGGEGAGIAAAAFEQLKAEAEKGGASVEHINKAFNDYIRAAEEAGKISPFDGLQGKVDLAKAQFADLLTRQAEGKPVSVDELNTARQRVVDTSKQAKVVEDQLRLAEAGAADGADGASSATRSYSQILTDLKRHAIDATEALTQLANGPLQKLQAVNNIADQIDNLDAALKKVEEDKANIAGTGEAAKAAYQAVVDAIQAEADAQNASIDAKQRLSDSYAHLRDAQDSVTTSLHQLSEAQHELDLYNSARGQEERALQLDIINRRVVNTPAEADQTRLDLLQFEDSNAAKQQQLQDAVASAQKGVNDALKGEADARRAIHDAQDGVNKALEKERQSHDDVTTAIKKQKQVQTDAMAALHADQRKVQDDQAAITVGLAEYVAKFGELPDGAQAFIEKLLTTKGLSQNIRDILGEIVKQQDALALSKAGAPPEGPQGPGGPVSNSPHNRQRGQGSTDALAAAVSAIERSDLAVETKARLVEEARGVWPGTIPDTDRQALHNFGVPGYAAGGIAETHVAQIATGSTRMWAEPETGGEAYIPLASSKRARSQTILATVAEKFGLHLTDTKNQAVRQYAEGGITNDKVTHHYADGGVVTGSGSHATDDPRQRSVVASQPAPLPAANAPATFTDDIARITAVITAADERLRSDVGLVTFLTTQIPLEVKTLTDDRATVARLTAEIPGERALLDHDRDLLHAFQALNAFDGLVQPANIDITHRSVAQNPNGSISTVRSITVGVDGGHAALIPIVVAGSVVSNQEAIAHYRATNQHLGIFVNEAAANHYAQLLHNEQAIQYGPQSFTAISASSVPHFAEGGVELHVAQIAAGSAPRVWAEPETGGEAYIPLASSKRARSTEILSTVAAKFGMHLVGGGSIKAPQFADGGSLPTLPAVPRTQAAERTQTAAQQRDGDAQSVMHVEFHGSDVPTLAELDYLNRENGWRLSRSGRS